MSKLGKLEETFNIASEKVEKISQEITISAGDYEMIDSDIDDSLTADGKVFELTELKRDFIRTKRHLQALIEKGQTLMDACLEQPESYQEPRMIEAISRLSETVGKQIKFITELYLDIADMEMKREKNSANSTTPEGSTFVNGNAIFVGSTSELMNHLNNPT